MRKVHWLFVLRASTVLGLFVSSALLVDYTSVEPRFCGHESGCGAVRASGLGYLPIPGVGFVPLPLLGVAGFSLFLGASLAFRPRQAARFLPLAAYAFGGFGALLLGVQAFVVGQLCAYCVVVDLVSVLMAVSAHQLRGRGFDEADEQFRARERFIDATEMLSEGSRVAAVWREDSRLYDAPSPLVRPVPRAPILVRPLAWALLGALALASPQLFPSLSRGAPVPPSVAELYVPEKINVVEFFDFECPHCRSLAPRLELTLRKYGDRVHFVRQYVPLPGHERAFPAALAALCAAEQGLEEPVAHELLTVDDLTDAGIDRALRKAGVDLERHRACLSSGRPGKRLDEDRRRLEEAEFLGLPTTYVGGTRLLGAQRTELYAEALERAATGDDLRGIPPGLYWALAALLAGLVGFFGRVAVPMPGGRERTVSS